MFEDWILAIGFPTGEQHAARKAALLRASLLPEGFRINGGDQYATKLWQDLRAKCDVWTYEHTLCNAMVYISMLFLRGLGPTTKDVDISLLIKRSKNTTPSLKGLTKKSEPYC